jgi:hypothetical protein
VSLVVKSLSGGVRGIKGIILRCLTCWAPEFIRESRFWAESASAVVRIIRAIFFIIKKSYIRRVFS